MADAYNSAIGPAVDPLRVLQRIVDEALSLVDAADGAGVELADPFGMTYAACVGGLADLLGARLPLADSLRVSPSTPARCCDATIPRSTRG